MTTPEWPRAEGQDVSILVVHSRRYPKPDPGWEMVAPLRTRALSVWNRLRGRSTRWVFQRPDRYYR
jgi:hypothetical protein